MRPKTYKNYHILLLLLIIKDSISIIIESGKEDEKKNIQEKKVQCVQKMAKMIFKTTHNLHLIADNLDDPDFYRNLHQFFSFTIGNTTISEAKKTSYIIIEDNILNLKNRFNGISFSKLSEYLILLKSTENLSEFASYLRRNEFYYVAFFLIDKNGDITLNQFNSRLKEDHETSQNLLTTHCNDNFLRNENNQKKVQSFNDVICPIKGCILSIWRLKLDAPISVYTKTEKNGSVSSANYAFKIAEVFSDKYQIQITSKLNESDFNMTWDEATKATVEGKVDLLCGFTFPEAQFLTKRMDISSYYMYEHLHMMDTWDTPAIIGFPGLKYLFAPLDLEIWVYLSLTVIFYSFFMCIVKKIHEKGLIREYLHPVYLINMFTKQDLLLPENGGLRIVVGMMLIFAWLINSFYECATTSSFIAPSPPIQLDTLKELMISRYRFAGPKFIRSFFNDSSDEVLCYMYERYEAADTNKVVELMYKDNLVMMHTRLAIQRVIWENRLNVSYYMSKEPFVYYPKIFFMKKGHPYLEALNNYILRVIESGTAFLWLENFMRPKEEKQLISPESASPLTFYQLIYCWLLLFYGLLISSVVFLCELLVNRFMCKNLTHYKEYSTITLCKVSD